MAAVAASSQKLKGSGSTSAETNRLTGMETYSTHHCMAAALRRAAQNTPSAATPPPSRASPALWARPNARTAADTFFCILFSPIYRNFYLIIFLRCI